MSTTQDPLGEEEFLAQLYKGGELLAAGKVVEAKSYLEVANRIHPKNEKAQNLLGLAYFKLGVFDRAAEIYEALVVENPSDPTLRVNLGLVYLKTNALDRSIGEFQTATDLQPDHKKAHNYLGLALAQAGDYSRARQHFVLAGSDAMAEKMARAIANGAPSAPVTVSLSPPPSVPPAPAKAELQPPPPAANDDGQIDVMSEEEIPPDSEVVSAADLLKPRGAPEGPGAAALTQEALATTSTEPLPQAGFEPKVEISTKPAPPDLHGDWGAQLLANDAPPPEPLEERFEVASPTPSPNGAMGIMAAVDTEMPVVEEMPVLDAQLAPEEVLVSEMMAPAMTTSTPGSNGAATATEIITRPELVVPPVIVATNAAVEIATRPEIVVPLSLSQGPVGLPVAALGGAVTAEVKTRPEVVVPMEFREAAAATTPTAVEAAPAEQDWSGVAETTTASANPSTVEVDWAQVNEPSSPALAAYVAAERAGVPLGEEEPAGVPLGLEEPAGVPLGAEEPAGVPLGAEEPAGVPLGEELGGVPLGEEFGAVPLGEELSAMPQAQEQAGVPPGEELGGIPLGEEPAHEEEWTAEPSGEQQWQEPAVADAGEQQWSAEAPAANSDQAAVDSNGADGLESMTEYSEPAQQGWSTEQEMQAEQPQPGLSAEDPVWGQNQEPQTEYSQEAQPDFPQPDVTPSWDTQGMMSGATAEIAAVPPAAQVDIDVPEDVHGAHTRRGMPSVSRSAPAATSSIDPGFQQMHVPRLNDLGPSLDWNKADMAGPFHLGNDGLALRVEGELFARLTGLVAVVGSVDVAPEHKRARGRATEWAFGEEDQQMHRCKGHGVVYLDAGTANFQALELDEGGAYIREERVFAFEESVAFENGRLTADNNLWLDLVHLKGQGRVLMKLFGQLKAMNIPAGRPLMVPLARVVGWYGAVTPRLVAFGGQGAIELVGEGYALLATPG